MLSELARREQEMSITQDPQANFLMEAMAPEYILKVRISKFSGIHYESILDDLLLVEPADAGTAFLR